RYDAAGRVIAEIAPNGAVTRYEYDALGRRTKVIDALGHETKYEYDAVGNQVAVIDALGTRTSYEYDAANRLVRTIFADGTAVSYEYDAAGRRISQTDQLFLTTGYGYDALGKLVSVTDALGQTTRYVYDEQGRMTEQIDANGHVTRFAYDPVGRLLEKTLPLGQKETYEYYPDGSLKAKTDPRGIRTEYIYDPVTRLLRSKVFSDGTRVDYTYWPDGRLKTATNAAGTLTYVYDAMGRLERLVDPLGNVISYTYDKAGNRTKISGPNGEISYTYDLLGRIETVTDQQGNVTRYSYDELGRQKKVSYPNGTETVYTHDALGRLLSVVTRKTTGEVISGHKYTLDAAGHRVKIEEVGSTVEYGYDRLYRLVSEKRNGIVALDDGYTYDPVGNRLTKTSLEGVASYTYDENDRLLSDGKYTYGWDEAGNLIGKTGPEGTTVYVYDAENRLIEANGPDGWVRFTYDAAGNRISRITSEGTTYFLVDPNMPYAQVLEETGPAGTKVYAYGNDLLNMQGPEGTRWFVYDGLGSTRALTDQAGTLTDAYIYEAFGALIHRTGVTANEFLFTGEQWEPGVGMYYLRARYYEPVNGRFSSADPLPTDEYTPIIHNRYIYCINDPVSRIDHSGLFSFSLAELTYTQKISIELRLTQIKFGEIARKQLENNIVNVALRLILRQTLVNVVGTVLSLLKQRVKKDQINEFISLYSQYSIWVASFPPLWSPWDFLDIPNLPLVKITKLILNINSVLQFWFSLTFKIYDEQDIESIISTSVVFVANITKLFADLQSISKFKKYIIWAMRGTDIIRNTFLYLKKY
ncbi:MAG: hypothetical protein K6U74_14880, partial [Firmicutes bacterium]|nr:hypothetical protein [Bacillota bacterium]